MNDAGLKTEVLLYRIEDGSIRLQVTFSGDSAWLTLNDLSQLFQRDKSVISRHIKNIVTDGELDRNRVVAKHATTVADGKTYKVEYFNLEMIIAVGYRVRSHRGTQFRVWATERLRQYVTKGFVLDDERLKRDGGGDYFEELLARLRDIRSSEKVFWRKILDIYGTSVDYDPRSKTSQTFFASIQNKMHFAAHGSTAAEIVYHRADATKPHMGMTNWIGAAPAKAEATVAKNYLSTEEIEVLNRIVTAYLEFAELQALNRIPMSMADWELKLDEFLHLSSRAVLEHAGAVSHEEAVRKAEHEYSHYHQALLNATSQVERDFEAAMKQLPPNKKTLAKKGGRKS